MSIHWEEDAKHQTKERERKEEEAMAVKLGETEAVLVTNEGVAHVKEELIADPETGVIMEVKKTKVAKNVGGGKIAVQEQIEIKGIKLEVGHKHTILDVM